MGGGSKRVREGSSPSDSGPRTRGCPHTQGFALLRQMTQQQRSPMMGFPGMQQPTMPQARPVYAPGYGLIPPSQVRAGMGARV